MPRQEPGGAPWQEIRDAMNEAGISVRSLARSFAGPGADAAKIESQRRKIAKWLKADDPTVPSEAQARLLAKALDKPRDYFVRPRPRRVDSRIERLESENQDLRQELARLRARSGRA